MSAYQTLEARFARLDALEGAMGVLHWDAEVMMPSGSMPVRAEQLSELARLAHQQMTAPDMLELLTQAEEETGLDPWQQANLREMRHQYLHANAVPETLVAALSKATTTCEHVWREARKERDYPKFAAYFAEVLKLVQEAAAAKADAFGLSAYDALLDSYDPGMRIAIIQQLFAPLEAQLPQMIQQAVDQRSADRPELLSTSVPIETQTALGLELMQALGFDFTRGRIDTSAHPFCGGVPGDIRLTTRYTEDDPFESLYAVLHETGHALYESGLPEAWRQQPVGKARGMSLHESQSLFIEMQLCRDASFIHYLAPKLRTHYGIQVSDEEILTALHHVERSLIRVNADELTYPLHILLRTKLEQALLDGSLPIADLPTVWDDEMERLLGIRPDHVGNGCLQDTHWPGGAIGYFPTYTVGAMIAAQLKQALARDVPDWATQAAAGEFTGITGWLQTHVHAHGSRYTTPELVEAATGAPLSPEPYLQHLRARYIAL
ncbi:MAG: carboxypeptidase M32 [Rickettsiales bacterium]|nr:carboxypeptidase M32 [Rickettsiales bacterium]